MGSYDASCGITGLPIRISDGLVFVAFARAANCDVSPVGMSQFSMHPWHFFHFVTHPVLARYDDYGRFVFAGTEADAKVIEDQINFLRPNEQPLSIHEIFEKVGDIELNVSHTCRKYEKAEGEKLKEFTVTEQLPIFAFPIHGFAYKELVNTDGIDYFDMMGMADSISGVLNHLEKAKAPSSDLPNTPEILHLLQDKEKYPEGSEQRKELTAKFMGRMELSNSHAISYENPLRWLLCRDNYGDSATELTRYMDFLVRMYHDGEKDKVVELLTKLYDFEMFTFSMQALKKTLVPPITGQSYNYELQRRFYAKTLQACNELVEREEKKDWEWTIRLEKSKSKKLWMKFKHWLYGYLHKSEDKESCFEKE